MATMQEFKMERFAKKIIPDCRCATRKFQCRGGGMLVELEHFEKHFIKNTRKRGTAGKHFGVFSPRYS